MNKLWWYRLKNIRNKLAYDFMSRYLEHVDLERSSTSLIEPPKDRKYGQVMSCIAHTRQRSFYIRKGLSIQIHATMTIVDIVTVALDNTVITKKKGIYNVALTDMRALMQYYVPWMSTPHDKQQIGKSDEHTKEIYEKHKRAG